MDKRFKYDDSSAAAAYQKNQLESSKLQLQNQLKLIEDKLRENERRIHDLRLASITPCSSWSAQDNINFMQKCRNQSSSLEAECRELNGQKSSIVRGIETLENQILRFC